ncbi:hypothetical protein G6F50_017796 [Rhizopus delemar]|uniref:Uncharacterized protein n=1 Tax=Rhizopus delemar TaxID=936053 RepID=A0A9P6XPF8_9FUNG|nr:hypothetical protein G6F50_017796 [Rhizopus delemar]
MAHRGQELALGQHRGLGGLLGLQQLLLQLALAFGAGPTQGCARAAAGQTAAARWRPRRGQPAARPTAARQSTALWKSKFRSLPADCTMLPWM